MTEPNTPPTVKLKDELVVIDSNLKISFRRTIRVPDNDQTSFLPPNLGAFPLERTSKYADQLPGQILAKGGLFLRMYQSEALWINFRFHSGPKYMIKIYVGGVNAISGEPAVEDAGTRLCCQQKLSEGHSLQDYVVVPGKQWLDGIAQSDGIVRQFVAMPFGSGHSVEHQVTGKDAAGGIQIEVTPYQEPPRPKTVPFNYVPSTNHSICVSTLTHKHIELNLDSWHATISDVKALFVYPSCHPAA